MWASAISLAVSGARMLSGHASFGLFDFKLDLLFSLWDSRRSVCTHREWNTIYYKKRTYMLTRKIDFANVYLT